MDNNFVSCIQFLRKSDNNCDRESARTQNCKMVTMTSSNLNFQKPRKKLLANICQITCAKFYQNRHNRLGCRADTHRQTHRNADTHTDIHPWFRWQHIQSKWPNIKMYVPVDPCGPPVARCSSKRRPVSLSSCTVMSTVPPPQSTTAYRVPAAQS